VTFSSLAIGCVPTPRLVIEPYNAKSTYHSFVGLSHKLVATRKPFSKPGRCAGSYAGWHQRLVVWSRCAISFFCHTHNSIRNRYRLYPRLSRRGATLDL
jgi:hypothetical protein